MTSPEASATPPDTHNHHHIMQLVRAAFNAPGLPACGGVSSNGLKQMVFLSCMWSACVEVLLLKRGATFITACTASATTLTHTWEIP